MLKSLFKKSFYYLRSVLIKRGLKKRLSTMPQADLTKEEKDLIRKQYDPLHLAYDWQWFRYYKFYHGYVNQYFVPRDVWKTFEYSLNPKELRFIQNKATLHRFIDKQYLPVTIINKFHGFIFDQDDRILSEQEATQRLLKHDTFVYKPTDHTGGGRGVKLVELKTIEDKEAYIAEMLKGDFFICQELIQPSKRITRFNNGDKTVNTVRCFTLCLNGKVSVLSGFMRMGGGQTFNDNASAKTAANLDPKTANGYVGIKPSDGQLNEFCLYAADLYTKYFYAPSGLLLKGEKLDFWKDITEVAVSLHQKLPMLGFIAWDFTIDADEHPRIIEINLDSQDVDDHQIFNGPIFKDYLQDIIHYTQTHPTPVVYG
jgi:hypothetical protein